MNTFKNIDGFEWDEHNINKIYNKHNISVKEAESIFQDNNNIFGIAKKVNSEKRFSVMGITNKNIKLIVFFTIRNSKIRIISARPQSRNERKKYNELTNKKD